MADAGEYNHGVLTTDNTDFTDGEKAKVGAGNCHERTQRSGATTKDGKEKPRNTQNTRKVEENGERILHEATERTAGQDFTEGHEGNEERQREKAGVPALRA